MRRLSRKYQTAVKFVPKPVVINEPGGKIGIIAFGSSNVAVLESRDQLKHAGVVTSYLRIRALPFTPEVEHFIAAHECVYVVEQNADGQMCNLLRMEYPGNAGKLSSVLHFGGLPIDARSITDKILKQES